jgi:tetratricopeptide (TPR) repeat protein
MEALLLIDQSTSLNVTVWRHNASGAVWNVGRSVFCNEAYVSRGDTMPGPNDPEESTERGRVGKLARQFGMNVNIKIGRLENGKVTGIEIGALNISLPQQTWLVLIAILLPTFVIAFILLYPQIVGPGPMNHDFNIAVAAFGEIDEQGRVVSSADASQLSDFIFNRLSAEFASLPEIAARVEVRHDRVGLVPSEAVARGLTERNSLNASLVIYGYLEVQNGEKVFAPQFYVQELKGAEELVGPNQFGEPLPFKGSTVTADEVKARTEALARFAIGLTYLVADRPDTAIARFNGALHVEGLKNNAGKEVIYLYLGTAYKVHASSSNDSTDLLQAYDAFSQALRINPQYSRAYIGLGNVAYEDYRQQYYRDPKKSDASKLDQAITAYRQALTARDKSAAANVDAKIHFSLGNIYVAKAQLGQPELFETARAEFNWVTVEFEQDLTNTSLKPIAAAAYCGLGVVNERGTSDYSRAIDSYHKCLDNSEGNSELYHLAVARLATLRQLP